jgi:uncharacterized membrane protein YesL
MSKIQKSIKDSKKVSGSHFKDYWQRQNYYFLLISFIFLVIGYYFMMDGSWDSTLSMSISPVVLLIAYLILIPLAIFFKFPTKIKEKLNVPSKD